MVIQTNFFPSVENRSVRSHVAKMALETKILLKQNCVTNMAPLQISVIDILSPSIVTIGQPPTDQAIRTM